MSALNWKSLRDRPEKHAQTLIHVRPHVLEDDEETAQVTIESRNQTNITVQPNEDDSTCYSLLEYIPFKDIQEKNIRVLNLPRKLCLHFSQSLDLNAARCLLDDDGINELCIELKSRARARFVKGAVFYVHEGTQTDEVETC